MVSAGRRVARSSGSRDRHRPSGRDLRGHAAERGSDHQRPPGPPTRRALGPAARDPCDRRSPGFSMKRRRRTTFKPDSSPSSPPWISHTFQEKVRLHAPRLFIAATAVAVATMLAGSAPATLAAPPPPPATNLLQRQLEAAAS